MITLITGATAGIGKETAFKMAEFGSNLILPVRNPEKGAKLKTEIQTKFPKIQVFLYECDLQSFQSIKDFVEKLKTENQKFQILINNAGLWNKERKVSQDGIEQTLAVNHFAPFLLTNLILAANLLENNEGKARIVNLSSVGHFFAKPDWNDLEMKNNFKATLAYYNSKLFNVLFTQKLTRILAEKSQNNSKFANITCNSLHPGIVNTNLLAIPKIIRQLFGWLIMTPEKGARTSFFVATNPSLENITGLYFDNCKMKKASKLATVENEDKLWQKSLEIIVEFLD